MNTRRLAALVAILLLVPLATSNGELAPGKTSDQTYVVRWLPGARIVLDGRTDEPAWKDAAVEKRFIFPWKQAPAPETVFRALCDDADLYKIKVPDFNVPASLGWLEFRQ